MTRNSYDEKGDDPVAKAQRLERLAAERAKARKAARAQAAAANREKYPEIAEVVDALRARGMFGYVERIYDRGESE